jgi:hypothetical protein
VAARQSDVVRSHLLGPMLGRGAEPAHGVVVGRIQRTSGEGEDPQRRLARPVAEPGLQAGGGIAQQDYRRGKAGGARRPFAVFEPALGCPFKIGREGKQASGELRQRKRPALAELGDQFDLYGRVERQH